MRSKEYYVDAAFLIVLSLTVIGLIINIYLGKHGNKQEPVIEPAETTIETVCEMTEVEVTEPTEDTVALYDVPLDEDLQMHIISEAEAHGIDPAIVMAMAYKESTYRTDAIGDSGNSYGLLQVQPRWHYERMQKLGCTDLLDPFQNVTVAVDYLADQIDRYGDLAKGLTAYNAGSYKGTITNYAKVVMALAEEMVAV